MHSPPYSTHHRGHHRPHRNHSSSSSHRPHHKRNNIGRRYRASPTRQMAHHLAPLEAASTPKRTPHDT
eukprot:332729-Prorocentrum_lima.AAC.1